MAGARRLTMIRQQVFTTAGELCPPEPPHASQLAVLHSIYPLAAALAAVGMPRLSCRANAALFLERYAERVCPVELAVVQQAFTHAASGHSRELIALDQSLPKLAELRELAGASALAGRLQSEHLRPLRDERLMQRYWEAVEGGAVSGHHWVVFGMTLALYSVPLRQGLLGFGRETLAGLSIAAGKQLVLPETDLAEPLASATERLPSVVEGVLSGGGWSGLATSLRTGR